MKTKEKVSINFTGDISFTGVFKEALLENKEIFDSAIIKIFEKANHTVVNLEGPATDGTSYLRNNGLVVSPPESIKYLIDRRIHNFNIANNHTFDNGIEGYQDTVNLITQFNGSFFGGGTNIKESSKPLILKANDISVALVAVAHNEGMISAKDQPGVFCIDGNFNLMSKQINNLKKQHDWVIVNYHGGEEYTRIPMPSRKKLLRKLSQTAADAVVAHHPHVFQGYEIYNGTPIFYSLGNFVFDIPQHRNINYTSLSAILQVNLSKTDLDFSFYPTEISVSNSKVISGEDSFIKDIEDMSSRTTVNYNKNWRQEAYRAFYKAQKISPKYHKDTHPPKGRRHLSPVKILLKWDSYSKLLKLLKSKNKRPLFFGAILHKIFDK